MCTSDLQLQSQVSSSRLVLQCMSAVSTPLQVGEWAALLSNHPDAAFVDYLLCGIAQVFRVGFKPHSRLRSAKRNFTSVEQHPEVVQKYLDLEITLGRVLGPFDEQQVLGVHVSSFGVIPKAARRESGT